MVYPNLHPTLGQYPLQPVYTCYASHQLYPTCITAEYRYGSGRKESR